MHGLGFSSFLDGFRPLSEREQKLLKGEIVDDTSIALIEAIKEEDIDEKNTDNGDENSNTTK